MSICNANHTCSSKSLWDLNGIAYTSHDPYMYVHENFEDFSSQPILNIWVCIPHSACSGILLVHVTSWMFLGLLSSSPPVPSSLDWTLHRTAQTCCETACCHTAPVALPCMDRYRSHDSHMISHMTRLTRSAIGRRHIHLRWVAGIWQSSISFVLAWLEGLTQKRSTSVAGHCVEGGRVVWLCRRQSCSQMSFREVVRMWGKPWQHSDPCKRQN